MTTHGDAPDSAIVDQGTDSDESTLPILRADRQQQVVLVEGEEITAVRVEGEGIFLPLRPMCAALGIDYSGQTQRIRRHDVMAEALRRVRIETGGGTQIFQCLELESTLMWLATVEGRRVKESLRERLHLYQRWVFKRVSEAFAAEAGLPPSVAGGAAIAPLDQGDQSQASSTAMTLRQVEQFGLSIAAMAREQLEFDQRLTGVQGDVADIKGQVARHDERLDNAAAVVGQWMRRLAQLEGRLYPGNPITTEQSEELKAKVHAVAQAFIAHGWASPHYANPYQALFTELSRRFSVPSYRALPVERYERAMTWLDELQTALAAGATPALGS
jgi:hypothetical protein